MTMFHPLPWFLIVALCLALAAVIHASSPFFRARLAEEEGRRYETLDGLRGLAALSVFFAHAATSYFWYTEGRWDSTEAHFYGALGAIGVCLFMMVTGFLFWSRVLREGESLNALKLYRSRIRRLVPMYLASVLLSALVVAVLTGFKLQTEPVQLLRELRAWLSFGFIQNGDLNGLKDARYINAVYWTLALEWAFYIALPFLALFQRGWRFWLLCALTLYFGLRSPIYLCFLAGALAALAVERGPLTNERGQPLGGQLSAPILAPLALGALGAALLFPQMYAWAPIGLMALFFLCVLDGQSLFGLLRCRPARLLGAISYSVYLVHCIVLYVVMRAVNARTPIGELGVLEYWSVAGLAVLLAVGLSALTYRYIEYPFLAPRSAPAPLVPPSPLERAHA
jgi:peptidoglycan/LPS O-acetylase OafA/YrhL